jgi:Icc protein
VRTLTASTKGEPLRLLQITDCHLFADPEGDMYGGCTRASLVKVLEAARPHLETCHAILATGDISQDESESSYRDFVNLIAPFERPVLSIPGNHDRSELMRTHLDQGMFQFCGAARGGNWLIIMLSSQDRGRTAGMLSGLEMGRWQELAGRHPDCHVLVCLHHQPVNIGSAWLDGIGLTGRDTLMQEIHASGNVRGVVWGHVHQEFESRIAGVHLLAAPSTCHQFVSGQDDFGMHLGRSGFRTLELHPDGRIETRVHWVNT